MYVHFCKIAWKPTFIADIFMEAAVAGFNRPGGGTKIISALLQNVYDINKMGKAEATLRGPSCVPSSYFVVVGQFRKSCVRSLWVCAR